MFLLSIIHRSTGISSLSQSFFLLTSVMIIIDVCATLKVALLHISRLNRSLLLHTVLLHFRERCVIPACRSINFILIAGRIKAVFGAWVKTLFSWCLPSFLSFPRFISLL